MANQQRVFHLNSEKINQILFCDNSDTEDSLALDNEDVEFLEQDMLHLENSALQEVLEVAIDPAVALQSPSHKDSLTTNKISSIASTDTQFNWKKLSDSKLKAIAKKYEEQRLSDIGIEFGKVLLDVNEGETTPYQVFEKLIKFENFITEIVMPQTILYSQQKGHVFTTTLEEIKAFFGMNIVMGYHKLPSIRDYWSSDPDLGVPYIANVMPLKRFEELRAYLHFNNNKLMQPTDDPVHDRAFKVRPVLDYLNSCFLNGMSATKNQSVDEHMVKFKGHNILKQYVKGKPVQWGFKLWCRCHSTIGYLFQFDLYTGKKTGHVEQGLGEGVVLSLTEQIKNLQYHVYIDNFFNTAQLQFNLLNHKIGSAGTVRLNRKNLPKSEQLPNDQSMNKGDMVSFESNAVYFTKWMDNKSVHMLSNILATLPVQDVQRKKKKSSGKDVVKCPFVVQQYNKHMGGVDLMDQKKVTYQFDHRSRYKYYLRLVHDLLDIAINNAGIVYNRVNEQSEQLDSKIYRRMVARALIGNYSSRKRQLSSSSILKSHSVQGR